MTWGPRELGGVDANRDYAFPPLHAEHDPGNIETVFKVIVPFKVNGERFTALIESLKRWAEQQGLEDFIEPDQLTYEVGHAAMTVWTDEEEES